MDCNWIYSLLWSNCGYCYCIFYASSAASIKANHRYNLEQLDDLSVDELEVLKETTDSLIEHIKKIKISQAVVDKAGIRKEIREVGVTIDRNVP